MYAADIYLSQVTSRWFTKGEFTAHALPSEVPKKVISTGGWSLLLLVALSWCAVTTVLSPVHASSVIGSVHVGALGRASL
jgi:hypothetical protein